MGKSVVVLVVLSIATIACAFRDIQDGAKILTDFDYNAVKDTYNVPLRNALKAAVGDRDFDDAEFTLLSRMKTVEIPPSEDATNYYAKELHSSNRFTSQHRERRSPQLKFDGQSSSKPQSSSSSGPEGPPKNHPKSIAEMLPRQGSASINFEGSSKDPKGNKGGNDEENKRLFPELFGHGGPYGHHGHHGGGYYPGGGHPYYPTAGYPHGYPGYPGGIYGNGGHGGGYYPGGVGYPGVHPGIGGAGSSSAAAASSSGGAGYRPGFGGGGLYGNGYYPNNGYYGAGYPTTYPIINAGVGGIPPPGHFGGFGGFRDTEGGKGGKVSAGASSSGGKVAGGVSFE